MDSKNKERKCSQNKIKFTRKRGRIDDIMELIKDSYVIFNHENETIEVIKNK